MNKYRGSYSQASRQQPKPSAVLKYQTYRSNIEIYLSYIKINLSYNKTYLLYNETDFSYWYGLFLRTWLSATKKQSPKFTFEEKVVSAWWMASNWRKRASQNGKYHVAALFYVFADSIANSPIFKWTTSLAGAVAINLFSLDPIHSDSAFFVADTSCATKWKATWGRQWWCHLNHKFSDYSITREKCVTGP